MRAARRGPHRCTSIPPLDLRDDPAFFIVLYNWITFGT
jgi:hypothetical protein